MSAELHGACRPRGPLRFRALFAEWPTHARRSVAKMCADQGTMPLQFEAQVKTALVQERSSMQALQVLTLF